VNLLADECVPRHIIERLRADGHTVQWIGEDLAGISDAEVLSVALEALIPLVTIDLDFGGLVFRESRVSAGVMLLRLEGLSNELKAELVSQAVRENEGLLPGNFTVVTPAGLRSRGAGPSV
jgi:predicted nuclease of predicted toxin-antitoxin system